MTLFRDEALAHRRPKLYGEVRIPTHVSHAALSALAFSLLIALTIGGLVGSYAKTERVSGQIVPTKGLVKIQSSKPGTLAHLYVEQGTPVEKGTPLVSVDTSFIDAQGQSIQQIGIDTLDKQLTLLKRKHALENERFDADMAVFDAEERTLSQGLSLLENRLALQQELTGSAQQTFEDSEDLRTRGYISRVEFEGRRQAYITAQQQVSSIEQEIALDQSKLKGLALERVERRVDFEQQLGQIETEVLALERSRAEIAGEGTFSLQSPVAGTVTSVLASIGKSVVPQESLVTILPEGGGLQAELYVPSRSIGFLKVGQTVKLAYDAFPYQQYGTFDAVVTSITRTMLLPDEVNAGFLLDQPAYRVYAAVHEHVIPTGTDAVSIRPGMRFDASIVLEKSSLFGWVWQSVTGVGGRV